LHLQKSSLKVVKNNYTFQAAIFDMDGVIVDNHTYHVKAWEVFCQRHSLPFDETSFRAKYFGKNNFDILKGLMERPLSIEEIDILGEEKEAIYRKLYKQDITEVEGLIQFLNILKGLGIKTAVATSAPTSNLDFTIDSLGIRHLFDVIVDASGITKGKPDPEIYLKAARLLNIKPDSCIVFEDSISGILAGKNAGMNVVSLLTTHKKEELPQTKLSITNFEGLTPNSLSVLFC